MKFLKIALALICFSKLVFADADSKFSEEDPNYPEKILNSLELWRYEFDSSDGNIAKRSLNSNSFIRERKLCESKISLIRPKKFKNLKEQLRTIINHLNYTQTVRVETCLSENFPCTFNTLPNSVQSFCQQRHSAMKLLAYDEVHHCIVAEDFLIPSSCDCKIITNDFLKDVKKNLL